MKYTWKTHLQLVNEAEEFLSTLQIDHHTNAIYDLLHILVSQEGKDPVRWICAHKLLLNRVARYDYISSIPEDLYTEARNSMRQELTEAA